MTAIFDYINTKWQRQLPLFVLTYCIIVLFLDLTANTNILGERWSFFSWRNNNGIDLFKLFFWLIVPFLVFRRRLDYSYIRPNRMETKQWLLFLAFLVITFSAAWLITYFNSLATYYAHRPSQPTRYLLFLGSWFFGWEFLTRWLLLTTWDKVSPRAWLVVPVIETLYHITKPWPEILGMAAFSIILCLWVKRTGSILFPVLLHLSVEIGLLVFLLNAR